MGDCSVGIPQRTPEKVKTMFNTSSLFLAIVRIHFPSHSQVAKIITLFLCQDWKSHFVVTWATQKKKVTKKDLFATHLENAPVLLKGTTHFRAYPSSRKWIGRYSDFLIYIIQFKMAYRNGSNNDDKRFVIWKSSNPLAGSYQIGSRH